MNATQVSRWPIHVSQWIQLSGGGWSGGNGCAEASLARSLMLFDAYTVYRASDTQWDMVRAVHTYRAPITSLQDEISRIARGVPCSPSAPETSVAGIEAALNAYKIPFEFVTPAGSNDHTAWDSALAGPMSVFWVDGSKLSGHYAGSYFGNGGQGNHLILRVPPYDEGAYLFNDPLADVPDRTSDVEYPLEMVRAAFYGAFLLPEPEPIAYGTTVACDLYSSPDATSVVVRSMTVDQEVMPTGNTTPHWTEVVTHGHSGWVLTANIHGH